MKNLTTTKIKDILNSIEMPEYSFNEEFKQIIIDKVEDYDRMNGEDKASLRSFLEDMQHGGCISGMIGQFVYHADCKEFYIKHIEDLEEFKEGLEEGLGEPITNRHKTLHYTFVVWLCFEEFCYNIYREVFEN